MINPPSISQQPAAAVSNNTAVEMHLQVKPSNLKMTGIQALRMRAIFIAAYALKIPAADAFQLLAISAKTLQNRHFSDRTFYKKRLFLLSSRILPMLLGYSLAYADATGTSQVRAELPEVKVSADFRNRPEIDTITSITVISADIISNRNSQHLEEVLNAIPNLNYSMGSNRPRFFQIRGIGERSQFVEPINSSVGVLIDQVDFSGSASIASLTDIEQIEVLRGPRGTRYGANGLAGLINLKSYDPTPNLDMKLALSAAEYNTTSTSAMLNLPLNGQLSSRTVVSKHQSDGYYSNSHLNRSDTNGQDELLIRTKLRFQLSGPNNLLVNLLHSDIDNGYDAFSLDNTRTTLSDEPGFDRQRSDAIGLQGHFELARLTLAAIANISNSDIGYGYDEDWSFTDIHPWSYTSTDHYFRERDNLSLELRLLSNQQSKILAGSTNWLVGLYHQRSKIQLERQYTFSVDDYRSTHEVESVALYGELETTLSSTLAVITGLRIEHRSSQFTDSSLLEFDPEDTLWGGRLALQFQLSDETMSYISLARGFKAGGFNTDGTLDEDLREFQSETLLEAELGYKGTFANNRLRFRSAIFYAQRRDQQVKSSLLRPRPDGSTEFIDFLGNAAEGTNRGIELEAQWLINERWQTGLSAGLLKTRFDQFINEFGEDLSGREQAQSPRYMTSMTLDYASDNWFAGISIDSKADYYFSDRHPARSRSFLLVNARIGLESERFRLSLWCRNLTNQTTYTRGFGSFGNDPRKYYVTEPYFQFGEPRVGGVTFEYFP
ncbi:MAG: TonB-dependent receptor [Gammaproteobacteria bacterium]|jgi:iron complex outermembrane recepter protein|nr:TonB-dependent receptor [Gammaproteobacteria bacterium]MBT5202846.1 TonB-dependent receptor [Gammaproteobacteria bacterium]MBT5604005.1 TonB-dependent receptor [Gammaproteobacteria bacterium]MBT6246011.1 TonB-dependent receptor [Gammaproteobacteria bacterium]